MEYTKYFSFVIKENGQPNLNSSEFRRMMNVIHLEGKLSGLRQVKESLKNTSEFYKYDILISTVKDKLSKETGNNKPTDLFEAMARASFD